MVQVLGTAGTGPLAGELGASRPAAAAYAATLVAHGVAAFSGRVGR